MEPLDLEPILDSMRTALKAARLGPGRYRRWLGPKADEIADGHEANPYGCADVANTLYTLAEFPSDPNERAACVRELQAFQRAEDGMFIEDTHHLFHVSAHCTAALELFEARPLYPLKAMHPMLEPGGVEAFLDQLAWVTKPWQASHQGAGLYAALTIAGEADATWEDRYFSWLANECDPSTGYWRKGAVETAGTEGGRPLFDHLAGSFHYLFNHEAAHRPLPYPSAMIDSGLMLREENLWPHLGRAIGFSEIDWIYCLTRARRQTGHRFLEVQQALEIFAEQYVTWLTDKVGTTEFPWTDIHRLFGTLCALAELQSALPGRLVSRRSLRLVLDRRPFI